MASYKAVIVKTGIIEVPDASDVQDAMAKAEKLGIENPRAIQWDNDWNVTDAAESTPYHVNM